MISEPGLVSLEQGIMVIPRFLQTLIVLVTGLFSILLDIL